MGNYTLTTLGAATELLDLPFDVPLAEWTDQRLVQVPRGISRHVVRFVRVHTEIFAIKEANERYVLREHRLLHELSEKSVPVVDAFGTVVDRSDAAGEPLQALLITRHLPFSLPYRSLFTGRGLPDLRSRLIDSHAQLSRGQRSHDITIATENIAGELFDLQAAGYADDIDPVETAMALEPRYEQLWAELVSDEVVARDESYRINQRIKRLNALGFDVSELAISTEEGGRKLRFGTHVVEPGHHQRRLFELTGLRVQENQARALLADLARFRAKWIEGTGEDVPEDLAARRWLDEKFYGTLALVPAKLRAKLPDAELFFEISEHRWFLSEAQGHDVGRGAAVRSYIDNVLRYLPDAKVEVLTGPPTEEFPAISP